MKLSKKGNLLNAIESIGGLVIPLIVIAVVLVVGFLILAHNKSSLVSSPETPIFRVNNETVTYTLVPNFAALANPGQAYVNCIEVRNTSSSTGVIPAAEYRCVAGRGIFFTNSSLSAMNSTQINVTYDYSEGGKGYNATVQVGNATSEVPGWLPIVVLVIIGGVLIAMAGFIREQTR